MSLSAREKARSQRSMVCLIQGLTGMRVTIELTNDSVVTGTIVHCDGFMSVEMMDVELKPINHSDILLFESFYVHGRSIRYIQIPDSVDVIPMMEQQLSSTSQQIHRMRALKLMQQMRADKDRVKVIVSGKMEEARIHAEQISQSIDALQSAGPSASHSNSQT